MRIVSSKRPQNENCFFKLTEGRAPMCSGSEFTLKAATLHGDSAEIAPTSREIEIQKISLGCGILAARFFPTFSLCSQKLNRHFRSRRAFTINTLAYDIVAWQTNQEVGLNNLVRASRAVNFFSRRLFESKRVSSTPAANCHFLACPSQ